MSEPVDLLLVSWNRKYYLEKTLKQFFDSDSNFRLYWWDNGSADEVRDLVFELSDERLVKYNLSQTNVNQFDPTMWFFDNSKSDVVGKIDDDILLPSGWIERLEPIVRKYDQMGMLSCWFFMEQDWDEERAAHKILIFDGIKIFRTLNVGGCSFLARKSVLERFLYRDSKIWGFPIDRVEMTRQGYISGYPLPLLYAHNMDDPRSEYCLMNRPGGFGEQAALSARLRKFNTVEEYTTWIEADIENILDKSVKDQLTTSLAEIRKRRFKEMVRKIIGR